jgi:AcrR family transcriptional regulator
MARDAEATRRLIFEVATQEFAAHGIAGARMDRIAQKAGGNKERIYAYFGNKDQLFDAVYSAYLEQSLAAVEFDATDLPGYAGRMVDQFARHPDYLRLSTWYRLERPDGDGLAAVRTVNRVRVDAIRQAQRAGVVRDDLQAAEILTLVQALAASWHTMNPEFGTATARISGRRRRLAVVDAVRRLVTPADRPLDLERSKFRTVTG